MDKKTVANIAYLSRLKLNADNEEKITSDLENIIKFVDQLNDVRDYFEPEVYSKKYYLFNRIDRILSKIELYKEDQIKLIID